jgi:putative zinc finger protein
MEHAGFPSDETLAAFIDGRVDAETRGRVIEHMADCSECYSVFIGATEMPSAAAEEGANVRPFRRARYLIASAAIAAAAAIGFFVTPAGQRLYRPDGLAALAGAAPQSRTFAGRITGFPYRAPAPVARGAESDPSRDPANYKLLDVAAKVQDNATKSPTAENLHALGVAQLLLGNANDAVQTLGNALQKSGGLETSNDVALLSDYSAALYGRATQTRSAADATLAARVAERAWSIRHTPETAWNRAIALDTEAAWRDFLALDSSSDWASEARRRLAR